MKILHVTHNDVDAVGCAVLVSLRYPNDSITTHFCAIGTQDQILTDEITKMNVKGEETVSKYGSDAEVTNFFYDKIIVSDLFILTETYNLIQAEIDFLKEKYDFDLDFSGYDHHITNTINEIADDFVVASERYDTTADKVMPISATRIMYDIYKDNIQICPDTESSEKHKQLDAELKHFCNSISRYDTWVWKKDLDVVGVQNREFMLLETFILKEDTPPIFDDDFYSILCKKYGPNDLYHMILNNIQAAVRGEILSWVYPKEFCMVYNLEKEIEDKIAKKAIKDVKFITEGEYIVGLYVPKGEFLNTIVDTFYDEYPCVDYWTILRPANKEISFRSNKEDLNVGRLAKRVYGGGGHKSASGVKNADTEKFLDILKVFYDTALTVDDMSSCTNEDPYKFIHNRITCKK